MVTEQTTSSDLLTVIAIAVLAYAGANISHEIIGHCGTMVLLGGKCSYISTTYIRTAPELPLEWRFRIDAFAGSGANWLLALICLCLLRARCIASPALPFLI